jgi:hypothetical protein
VPVLEKCLNFHYSPCQSHWTAVRSCSEEISVAFTEYIRILLLEGGKKFKIHRKGYRQSKILFSMYSDICYSLLSRYNGFWEWSFQTLGNNVCFFKYINSWNSSKLSNLSFDNFSQSGLVLGRVQKKQRVFCCGISFKAKFISNHSKVQKLHVYSTFFLLRCSLLFSRSPNPNTDRQKSHYSDGSNLNSGCNIQHKHLSYTWNMQKYLCNFLTANLAL